MINCIKLLLIYLRNPGMSNRDYDAWVNAWEDNLDGMDVSEYFHKQKMERYTGKQS